MRNSEIVILCCYCVIFVSLGVAIKQEYFSDSPEERTKRVKLIAYVTAAMAWAVMGLAQWIKMKW